MPAQKNYILDISRNADQNNIICFTVRSRKNYLVKIFRLPLLICSFLTLACVCFNYCLCSSQIVFDTRFFCGHLFQFANRYPPKIESEHIQFFCRKGFQLIDQVTSLRWIVFLSLLLLLFYGLQEKYDSMLVIQDIGIQLSSQPHWKFFMFSQQDRFIPVKSIIDLVIHEGFHGYGQVIFYMCVLLKPMTSLTSRFATGKGNLVKIVFPQFLPNKGVLITVWGKSRIVLFGTARRYYQKAHSRRLLSPL